MITLVKFCKIISRYRFAFSATNRDRAAFKTQLRPAPPSCLRTTPRWLRNSRDRAQSSSVRKQATAMHTRAAQVTSARTTRQTKRTE